MGRVAMCLFFMILATCVTSAFAAQSTVPISVEQKEAALRELLDNKIGKLQRDEEYIIGHGDILSVSLYEEGDMAAAPAAMQSESGPTISGIQVMMDGRIALKDVGEVEVVGLTLAELAEYLKTLYANLYDNPIVITTLIQSNSLRYTIMGEVAKPGIFKIEHPITIVQAIAQAGGFTEWAKRKATVVRKDIRMSDKKHFEGNTLEFDYGDFVTGEKIERNIYLRSEDFVIVY